jgi:hypothetical protein
MPGILMKEFDGVKEPEMSEAERQRRLRDGTLAVPGLVYHPGYTLEMALASVGPGWKSLVQETFDAVRDAKVGAVVTRVEEKWGALRIN